MITRFLFILLLALGAATPSHAQLVKTIALTYPFRIFYAGGASVFNGSVGSQLILTAGSSSTFTVSRQATLTVYSSAAGGHGGIGAIGQSGGGGGGGAVNSGGISLSVAPGKVYTYVVGAAPGGNTSLTNTTDAIVITSLTGGANGTSAGPGLGGAGGTVVTGAGTAGGAGGNAESGGGACAGGGGDGAAGASAGGGGGGGGANDGGTGAGCGGAGAGGVAGLAGPDGYTGGSGGYGVSATICGQAVGGGGGGGGGGTGSGGSGGDNTHRTTTGAGIVCLVVTSIP